MPGTDAIMQSASFTGTDAGASIASLGKRTVAGTGIEPTGVR